jgi:para-aminobenzoate synthetase component 1
VTFGTDSTEASTKPCASSDELDVFERMDSLGAQGIPFLFVLDHDLQMPMVHRLDEIDASRLLYDLRGFTNAPPPNVVPRLDWGLFDIKPPPSDAYAKAFSIARLAFLDGESYLLNLTASSAVQYTPRLAELFPHLQAPYRLWVDGSLIGRESDGFLVFSPECFVRIEGLRITTFPMKGSLRCTEATRETATEILLSDEKEAAEHVTVVDLLRNDLSRVATDVRVPEYRYPESIPLPDGILLQTSSRIEGDMEPGWPRRIGQILSSLLPAGSVTGAPKERTCQHIRSAENMLGHTRGFYTGVFGIFDGTSVDSAVMIRFLEDRGPTEKGRHGLFKSGGGLTVLSECRREEEEMQAKIALPLPPVLFETIRVQDGIPLRLEEHQARIDASHLACFGTVPAWRLAEVLAGKIDKNCPGRVRLRLVHCRESWTLETFPYVIRRPDRFLLVDASGLSYGHKYADRSGIEALRARAARRHGLDIADTRWDILLTREGFLLEASYASIACLLDGTWQTPSHALLPSTRSAAYAKEDRLIRSPLRIEDISRMERILAVNAMLDLEDEVEVRLIVE